MRDGNKTLGIAQDMLDHETYLEIGRIKTIPKSWSDILPDWAGHDISLDEMSKILSDHPMGATIILAIDNMAADGKHKGTTINFSNDPASLQQAYLLRDLVTVLFRYFVKLPGVIESKGTRKS